MADERKYYEPFQLIKYEKISDDIFHMGKYLMIKICATLARTANGTRYFFYKEYEYQMNRIRKVSVKRSFDYYISIEEMAKHKNRDKLFIRIGPAEYYGFMDMIQEAMKWFTRSKYSKLYAKKGAELVFASSTIPSKTLSGLPMGISITLAPDIMDAGKEFKPSVKIIVDTGREILDYYMTVDNLFGIYGALVNYNMFMSAQSMIGSLGIPLGTNRTDLYDESNSNQLPDSIPVEVDNKSSSINGRLIGGSKIEDLE